MAKYEVGDILMGKGMDYNNCLFYKITGITNHNYLIDNNYKLNSGKTKIFDMYSIANLDKHCRLAIKKIKDTKIARKMNKGNIIAEDSGYITVRVL